jgi:conjugal transfer ATP-binding protein TraC
MTDLIGDAFRDTLRFPCAFLLKETIYILDRDKAERRAGIKGARAKQLAGSKVAIFMPRAKKISANWDFVNNRLEEGERIIGLMFQVILYAPKQHMNRAANMVKNLFQAKSWKLAQPRMLQFPFWLGAMPMVMGDGLINDMRYFNLLHTKLGYNAVNMAPLQGEWKGLNVPLMLLTGRRGQIMWWDPFANDEGNYNIAVAGKSGSGKSVFLQELEVGIVGSGGRVFVIDVGHSSEKLCRLLEGEFIEFHPESDISINPFTHIKDFKESLAMLKPMFALMAAPTRKTNDFENALIEKALTSVWDRHGKNGEVTEVAKWLLVQEDLRAKDLGTMLYPYTREGSYGRFFTGPCNLDFTNPFINLELEALKSKKDLQEVVLCMLMYHVTEVMYRGDRSQRIACVIDEAWDIFRGELGGEFIETGYRRARKYQGSFISGTQGINDYYKNAATIAALENSDWLALLAQKEESLKQLKKSDRLSMDGHIERLLNSVKTLQGVYSEIFIKGPASYAVGRLMLDPFSRLLYSSKGDEFAAVNALREQGLSVGEAIEKLTGERL